jgi:hypothetical protein
MIEARRGLTPPRRATAAADHNSSGMAVSPWRICRHRSKRERTSSMLGVRELRPQVFECLPPTLPAKERPYHPCAPTFTHPCGKLTLHLMRTTWIDPA